MKVSVGLVSIRLLNRVGCSLLLSWYFSDLVCGSRSFLTDRKSRTKNRLFTNDYGVILSIVRFDFR